MLNTIYFVVIAQIPPTPTFAPTPNPADFLIDVPETDMWQFAAHTVGTWNNFGREKTEVVQVMFLLLIIIVSVTAAIILFKRMRSERVEE